MQTITAPSQVSQYKIIRLTAPIFTPGETELSAFAAQGLPITVVDTEQSDEMIPLVADADIVAMVGTTLPTRVVEALAKCRAIARTYGYRYRQN